MEKNELFQHIRDVNETKLTLNDVQCNRSNDYYNVDVIDERFKFAKDWNLVSILTEASKHHKSKIIDLLLTLISQQVGLFHSELEKFHSNLKVS